jgi:hypothetical protein
MENEKLVVFGIWEEKDKISYYNERQDYHVIASPSKHPKAKLGDTILYEPYGANFGWFISIVKSDTNGK